MKLLAIETATQQLGVAVIDGERALASYELLAEHPHAAELPGAVMRVLKASHLTLPQVDAIAVDVGPGSFTGLRIGLAFVKALTWSMKKPVVGVSSLDVLVANLPLLTGLVCPVLDAKQKNIYTARYTLEGGQTKRLTECLLGPVEQVVSRVSSEPVIFLGDACAIYRERLLAQCPQGRVAASEFWLPRAAALGRLAMARLERGETDDPRRLVPMYLYPQDCQVRGPNRPTSVLPTPAPVA